MKSWGGVKKRLEQDFLAQSLRGRVTYFMTRYTHAHDEAGRVAIRVDGREVLTGFDMDWWMHHEDYRKEALRRFPEISGVFDPANFIQCGQDTAEAWALLRPFVVRALRQMVAGP